MEERDFFDEKAETKRHTLMCRIAGRKRNNEVSWLVRTKKKQIPNRADERDRPVTPSSAPTWSAATTCSAAKTSAAANASKSPACNQ